MEHEGTGEQSPYQCVQLLSHHVTMSLDLQGEEDLQNKAKIKSYKNAACNQ